MSERFWLAISFLATGCADLARPDLDACKGQRDRGAYEDALSSCQRAANASADSEAGQEASGLLAVLQPKAQEQKAQREAREAAEAHARDEAAKAAAAKRKLALAEKVTRDGWDESVDSVCAGNGMPKYRWTYSGGTYDENIEAAKLDGCVLRFQAPPHTDFCCPMSESGLFWERLKHYQPK